LVKRLLGYADLPDQIGHRRAELCLLQHRDDLLDQELLPLHCEPPPSENPPEHQHDIRTTFAVSPLR
jgi:hypothetical protein